jgi:hypothetical protein
MKKAILAGVVLLLLALAGSASAQIVISEVLAQNGEYKNGKAYDWVELYNPDDKDADISGFFLSDNKDMPEKWAFPSGAYVKAHMYALVYCTGEAHADGGNGVFYTGFSISASGETLLLSSSGGEILQTLAIGSQYGNVSYGIPAGGDSYLFLVSPTPGKKNTAGYPARADSPLLSTPGGFYTGSVTVPVTAGEGMVIRYTLDGSEPTEAAAAYRQPFLLTKTTVLRARAFGPAVPSVTATATYFINDPSPVPVISLVTDEQYLFDSGTGALVAGAGSTPNYEKELEYPVNIEYYSPNGVQEINQEGTFTAAGHSARVNSQKSIALYTRGALGGDRFIFNPFPNRDYTSYKSLLLRAANSDAWSTRLRDPVISSMAEGMDILYQDAAAVVVYINGVFWGHYNLREKINKYFIAQWEGINSRADIDGIDILARTGIDDYVQNGSNDDWLELMEFCRTRDLNVPLNLQYVTDRLDVESLFTHTAFEMIIGNSDMTNVRMYRVPGGKWKYLLFDVEASFSGVDEIPISYYMKSVSEKRQRFQHVHFAALMQVPEMRAAFLRRFAEVLETGFQWPQVERRFLAWKAVLEELMPRHLGRWKGNLSLEEWRTNIGAVMFYARVRPVKVIDMLCRAMHVTSKERETYFGAVQALLDAASGT